MHLAGKQQQQQQQQHHHHQRFESRFASLPTRGASRIRTRSRAYTAHATACAYYYYLYMIPPVSTKHETAEEDNSKMLIPICVSDWRWQTGIILDAVDTYERVERASRRPYMH
ncbi:hypothetical protein M441DRAFT_375561 [Trichoderma asperellum CBS 433.97]|uniref:Uncharacterized protein n=1 Tax=Trichoderma asperellum (strain ATCC 204424 / CBS 433.97 / NBRC 101777) TaxID=1042311 RepID=A0A2T3ZFM5_TRIA4|nr:hypothetical protein M441DRAFT_375561 [Trichoderma asperellum CBS 433.97]PTB43599.1 hypothetical protein M441DRAFT_375561 [Trichoderma asperellum CBS 433.97]